MHQHISFRNSKIIYYGPHACGNCGANIAKMGHEFGGTAFTYPDGPIYPNTEWHPHVCDPAAVSAQRALHDAANGQTVFETRNYTDGSSASGPGPLPDHSPNGAPQFGVTEIRPSFELELERYRGTIIRMIVDELRTGARGLRTAIEQAAMSDLTPADRHVQERIETITTALFMRP